jgi:antitoxin YefM
MRVTSYSNLRKNLSTMMDQVHDDHTPVIITRDGGKSAAVLMSLEDFASYQETAYLLRSPANAKNLLEAIAELDAGKGIERDLLEWKSRFQKKLGNLIFIGKPKTNGSWKNSTPWSKNAQEHRSRVAASQSFWKTSCQAGGRGA